MVQYGDENMLASIKLKVCLTIQFWFSEELNNLMTKNEWKQGSGNYGKQCMNI